MAPVDALIAAAMAGDVNAVDRLRRDHPDVVDKLAPGARPSSR